MNKEEFEFEDDEPEKGFQFGLLWQCIAWAVIIFTIAHCTMQKDALNKCQSIKDEKLKGECIIEVSK